MDVEAKQLLHDVQHVLDIATEVERNKHQPGLHIEVVWSGLPGIKDYLVMSGSMIVSVKENGNEASKLVRRLDRKSPKPR